MSPSKQRGGIGIGVESDTPESYLQSIVKPENVTYRRVTASYFVVSRLRDGDIYYQRCNFAAKPDGIIHCFAATYPTADKAAMDAIIPRRLSQSLHGAATGPRFGPLSFANSSSVTPCLIYFPCSHAHR